MSKFTKISRSSNINGKRYSNREDYIKFLSNKYKISEKEVLNDDNLIIKLTKNWFRQGQVGCGFAQYMAHDTEQFGWRFMVERETEFTNDTVNELFSRINNHIIKSNDEVLSILFPNIDDEYKLASLVKSLVDYTPFFIDGVKDYSQDQMLVSLRLDISGSQNYSWIMALGPYDNFPLTRQCPITQLVIRLKVKDVNRMYHKAKNVSDAHNADIPVDMIETRKQDALWELSFKNTKRVLGHKPDDLSAAKYTCPISIDIYNKLFKGSL